MAQLFISYSRQDIEFARYLRGLLQAAGFEVWMDERLVPSTQWWRMLEEQIKASSALIVVMSPSSAESRWVEREILVAENSNMAIFPLLLDGPHWSRLADIQYEDFTAGLKAELPPRLVDALRLTVNGTPPERRAARPVRATAPPATESRLLEAAMPAETRSGGDSEMWAKISLPDSAGLRAELPAMVPSGDVIQKGDARTTSFPFRFPTDPRTGEKLPVQMTLKASSADFSIRSPGGDEFEIVELPPDTDSRTVIFTLFHKPGGRVTGRARLFLDLIYENRVIAQISVSTQLVEQVSRLQDGAAPWSLWSVPLGGSKLATGEYQKPDLSGGIPASALMEEALPGVEEESLERAEADAYGDQFADDGVEDVAFEADEAAWQGAFPTKPISPPAPEPPRKKVSDRQSPQGPPAGSSETMASRPASARQAPRRTSPLVTGASAIAGLALVFVVVLLLVNRQSGAPPQDVTDATLSMGLAAQEAATNTARASTATQDSVLSATQAEPEMTLTSPVVESGEVRSGIAAAKLANCEGSLEDARLSNLLDELNIPHALLSGDMVEGVAGQVADPTGAALVFWGTCQGDGSVLVTAELLAPPLLRGILHPERVEFAAPVEMMLDNASPAGTFLRAIASYMKGTFDAGLLDELVAAEEGLPSAVDNTAGRAALNVLLGTTHLFHDENYEAALSRYRQVDSSTATSPDIVTAALNNSAFAILNRLWDVDPASDPEWENQVNSADHALEVALDRSNDPPAQHLPLLLSRATLRIFIQGQADATKIAEGLTYCENAASNFYLDAEPLACTVAARLSILSSEGDLCNALDDLDQLLSLLADAHGIEPDEPYAYFWEGIVLDHQALCKTGTEEHDGLHAGANAAFEQFVRLMDQENVHLAIDRAFLAEARARITD
ncbi:MAG: toll/interleukin-1 receptor domain-containing protein [Chloroflexi bacterium]|nr:toll/interleukin-1 receptor domain-containing protein [Chloroflexota bacterium]